MNYLLSFLPFVALLSAFGFLAEAEEIPVSASRPLQVSHLLSQATTFVVENSMGDTEVYEVDGETLTLDAKTQGEKPVTVKFGEIESGKYKVFVEYPDFIGVSSSGRNHSVSISGLRSGSSIFISGNGQVIVNNQVFTAQNSSNSPAEGPVQLRLGVPKSLLAHIKLISISGDLSLKGRFSGPEGIHRKVELKSVSGDIEGLELVAMGGLNVETTSGDINLENVKTFSASVKSVSGDLQMSSVDGDLTLHTVSGDILSDQGAGDVRFKSVSGSVRIRGRIQAMISGKTTSGDIRFSNPDDSAREEASSVGGNITGLKKGVRQNCSSGLSGKGSSDPFQF